MNRSKCLFALSQLLLGSLIAGAAWSASPQMEKGAPIPSTAPDANVPPVSGLAPDHAAISVENIDVVAEWYQRILGFKVFSRFTASPTFSGMHMVIPGYRIDLIKMTGSKRPPKPDPIYMQQGWIHVVFHVDDVAKAWKELQAHHVDVDVNKDDSGTPIQLLLHDPEGNEVEIRRNLTI